MAGAAKKGQTQESEKQNPKMKDGGERQSNESADEPGGHDQEFKELTGELGIQEKKPEDVNWKLKVLKDNLTALTEMLEKEVLETVIDKICNLWGCDNSNFIKTAFQILFMELKEPQHLDVSRLLHALLSIHPNTESEDSTELHGSKEEETIKKPTSLEQLRKCIQEAATANKKIKAVGTQYSKLWTGIGDTEGILIDTSGLTDLLEVIRVPTDEEKNPKTYVDYTENNCYENIQNRLKNALSKLPTDEEKHKEYFHFQAGITMNEIQNKLWPENERNKTGPNHRVFPSVTNGSALSLAGTVSTGAHGNGIKTKTVADAVVSFQMFTVDSNWKVKRYQIEPTDGITDPRKFNTERIKNRDADEFKLIQDTEWFNASVVNMGCMGVVYSYVLETVEAFYLEEERIIYKWSDAKQKIRDLYKDPNVYNFQVIGSPYAYRLNSNETDEHRVLISVLRETKTIPFDGRGERFKVQMDLPMGFLDKILVAIGNSNPHLIPVLMHFPLQFMEHKKVVLNAVEALNTLSGVVSKKFSGVRTSECAMRSEGPETVIEIMEDLHELYSDIRRSNNRQLVNVPIALRFTAPSNKYMAMEYDYHRPTITIEQSIISGTLGADDTLRQFRKRMFKNFQGRPHWGLLHEMDAKKFKILYGSNGRKKFTSALNYFDPNHVFENNFAAWVFGKEREESILPSRSRQSKQQTEQPSPKGYTGTKKHGNEGEATGVIGVGGGTLEFDGSSGTEGINEGMSAFDVQPSQTPSKPSGGNH